MTSLDHGWIVQNLWGAAEITLVRSIGSILAYDFRILSEFDFSHLPSEEFLGVWSGDGEGDDGPVNAALADEGVFGTEG